MHQHTKPCWILAVPQGKSKIFLISCVCFIFGIIIASFLPVKYLTNNIQWFIGMIACVVLLVLCWNTKNKNSNKNQASKIHEAWPLFLFLFLVFFGIWRCAIAMPTETPDKIWHYNGQKIVIHGNICKELDIRKNNQQLTICVNKINDSNFNVTGKVLAITNLYPIYNYNEKIKAVCDLEAPQKFKDFAYDKYLARYDIYSVCYYPEIRQETPNQYTKNRQNLKSVFYQNIFSFKNKLHELINFGLTEPEASLASAITLGYKKNIPDDLRAKFAQTGLSHIMAISGMHISILVAVIFGFLINIGLRRKVAFWFVILFLFCYIILIGLPASAMRAGLMGFLVLFAIYSGRFSKPINLLIFTAAFLLLINPKLLLNDIGFQLSFLAVLGIIWFYPVFNNLITKNLLKDLNPKGGLIKTLITLISVTLSAQILILPIIAYNFSQISLISPISNLLILWILPFLMIAILIALILGLILPSFAFLFFFPAGILLKYVIIIVNYLAQIPYSYIEVNYLWHGWLMLYCFFVFLLLWKLNSKVVQE